MSNDPINRAPVVIKPKPTKDEDLTNIEMQNRSNKKLSAIKFTGSASNANNVNLTQLDSFTGFNTLGWYGFIYTMPLIGAIKNWDYAKFEWGNLPKGLTKKRIQQVTFQYGSAVVYKEKLKGVDIFRILPFHTQIWNDNGEPINVKPYVMWSTKERIYKKAIPVGEGTGAIILYHDRSGDSYFGLDSGYGWGVLYPIWMYLLRFERQMRKIACNDDTVKTKLAMLTDGDQDSIEAQAFQNQWDQDGFVIEFKGANMKEIMALTGKGSENKALIQIDDMNETYFLGAERWADKMKSYLGINHNSNKDKKERQITNEVDANNQEVNAIITTQLQVRQEFIEEFETEFKIGITVKLSDTFDSATKTLVNVIDSAAKDIGENNE